MVKFSWHCHLLQFFPLQTFANFPLYCLCSSWSCSHDVSPNEVMPGSRRETFCSPLLYLLLLLDSSFDVLSLSRSSRCKVFAIKPLSRWHNRQFFLWSLAAACSTQSCSVNFLGIYHDYVYFLRVQIYHLIQNWNFLISDLLIWNFCLCSPQCSPNASHHNMNRRFLTQRFLTHHYHCTIFQATFVF